jgi:hypothetical protein
MYLNISNLKHYSIKIVAKNFKKQVQAQDQFLGKNAQVYDKSKAKIVAMNQEIVDKKKEYDFKHI